MDFDIDSNGVIVPIELGIQEWNEGYLVHLNLLSAGLSGTIPNNIDTLIKLEKLSLQNNFLIGDIPVNIEKMVNLISLNLSNNQLSGSIPDGIGNLINLEKLLLNNNQLSGNIPENICDISILDIINNKFCSSYPDCIDYFAGDNSCFEEFIKSIDIIGKWEYNLFEMDQNYCDNIGQCMECIDIYLNPNTYNNEQRCTDSLGVWQPYIIDIQEIVDEGKCTDSLKTWEIAGSIDHIIGGYLNFGDNVFGDLNSECYSNQSGSCFATGSWVLSDTSICLNFEENTDLDHCYDEYIPADSADTTVIQLKDTSDKIAGDQCTLLKLFNYSLSSDFHIIPSSYTLSQNFPNPFNPTTYIRYSVPYYEYITIDIFNIRGQIVKTLIKQLHQPGNYEIMWDGTNHNGTPVPSGIYFYKMNATDFISVRKLVLLK